MGIKAYNVGDRDLALGIKLLKKLAGKAAFPFLSSNILDQDGKPIFKPSVMLKVAGYKVAVIGAVTTVFVNRRQTVDEQKITVMPPEDLVAKEVQRRKKEGAEIFILLGHLNSSENQKVIDKSPELHFILGGQEMQYRHGLSPQGKTLIAEAFMRGKNLSVLHVEVNNGLMKFVDRNYKNSLVKRVSSLENQVKARTTYIETAKKDPKKARSLEYFERNLVQLKTELQTTKMDLEDATAPDPDASQVSWELKGVDTSLEEEKKVAELVAAYRKKYPDPTKTKKPAAVLPTKKIGPRRSR